MRPVRQFVRMVRQRVSMYFLWITVVFKVATA
jgi:hypothetical protein